MQSTGGVPDWLVATLGAGLLGIGVLYLLAVSLPVPFSGPILSTAPGPLPPTSTRSSEKVLDISGIGALRQPMTVAEGDHVFRWFATAGEADCTFRLVIEGSPTGPIVADDYGRIDGGASASGLSRDARLPAGDYVLVADTDCPGMTHVSAGRYLD
ncbi:MAG TPA: hypothetical protein VLA23_12430 [Candidatus Limnocylindrales bacterium]|nr:hypothetical protein [Candidatus Limnocylindrales bacterium]